MADFTLAKDPRSRNPTSQFLRSDKADIRLLTVQTLQGSIDASNTITIDASNFIINNLSGELVVETRLTGTASYSTNPVDGVTSSYTLVRQSNQVSLFSSGFTGTASNNVTAMTTAFIPSALRPSSDIVYSLIGTNNGSATAVKLTVNASGSLLYGSGVGGSAFTASSTAAVENHVVTWVL